MAALTQSNKWRQQRVIPKYKPVNFSPLGHARRLGRFRQIFPLTLFPDDLVIEEQRVVWVLNKGPWIKEMISTMAADIASIDSSTGPFMGHIHIRSLTGGPEIIIDKLPKNDVLRARFLIEGIVLSARRGDNLADSNLGVVREYLIANGTIN